MGDLAAAGRLLDEALAIYDRLGYPIGEAEVRNSAAALVADTDGDEAGCVAYAQSLELALRAEHPLQQAHALAGLAHCELRLGQRESGLEHLRRAVDLYRRMRSAEYAATARFLAEAAAVLEP
jgi:hypothetical protein